MGWGKGKCAKYRSMLSMKLFYTKLVLVRFVNNRENFIKSKNKSSNNFLALNRITVSDLYYLFHVQVSAYF